MDMFQNLQKLIDKIVGTDGKPSKQEILLRTHSDCIIDCVNSNTENLIRTTMSQIISKLFATTSSLNENIHDLKTQISGVKEQLAQISEMVEEMDKGLKSLNETSNTNIKDRSSNPDKNVNFPVILFANIVDSDTPIGFIKDNLSTESSNCLFELCIRDNFHGTYQFVNDISIHQEALSAFDPIITSSSQYATSPTVATKIIIQEPGTVELYGNIWKIISKQKIKFE